MSAQAAPPTPILVDPNPGVLRWTLHAAYDLCWILAVLLASPWWILRCATTPRFRAMASARLGFGLPRPPAPGARPRILIHGVSVGEVKAAQSLVRALAASRPDLEIVISTTTDTGLSVARRLYTDSTVVRFPLDLSPVVSRFLDRVAPVCVVLVELEIWPNFLRQANRHGVPVAVVNGRITGRSFGHYHRFRDLLPQFNRLTLLCVQDEEYAARFGDLVGSRERILVTGNIKADGLRTGTVDPGAELAALLGARDGQRTLVAGSTHDPEERLVVQACARAADGVRLILVPRHPERAAAVVRELTALGSPPQLLSRLRAGEVPDPSRPALVDTMGELEHVYALADVVFVGGSLVAHGGQNVLEPAAQGKPVVHGPNLWNFAQEEALLAKAGASRRVEDEAGLERALAEILGDDGVRTRMARAGIAAVQAQKGATEVTNRALLDRCLPPEARARDPRGAGPGRVHLVC
ncbi:MAG TPA: glycosyltransferase N-terminal domain-containing protein [Planctomycetota bacterium]|jgi:3-deoxy-D-manno-octulosonic-acid transferase|nr:glycosyltransferase N-terminal domain-containing protein [Planctomycetota bacterium]